MQKGFIDMSSLHSALCLVRQGRNSYLSKWHGQSLLDVTYLLLHSNIRVIPRLGRPGGEAGDTGTFLAALPNISTKTAHKKSAMKSTLSWLNEEQIRLNEAWLSTKDDKQLWEWAVIQRDLKWEEQSETYGSLFDEEFIPVIAKTLQMTENDLRKIHLASGDTGQVKEWLKRGISSEDAKVAESAWLVGGLVRGKYYENLAKASGMQLVAHPYRFRLSERLESCHTENVTRVEELFVKVLIASAQLERTPKRRIAAWGENIDRAKRALGDKIFLLHETRRISDAEENAYVALKRIGIVPGAKLYRRLLEGIVNWQIPALMAYSLSPWITTAGLGIVGATVAAGQVAYKHWRGISVGEEAANFVFSNKLRFRWLAKSVPGRIHRQYFLGPITPPAEAD